MFHMAYLIGSIISTRFVLDLENEIIYDPVNDPANPHDVLF